MTCTFTAACGAGVTEITGDTMSVAVGYGVAVFIGTLDGGSDGIGVVGVVVVPLVAGVALLPLLRLLLRLLL